MNQTSLESAKKVAVDMAREYHHEYCVLKSKTVFDTLGYEIMANVVYQTKKDKYKLVFTSSESAESRPHIYDKRYSQQFEDNGAYANDEPND